MTKNKSKFNEIDNNFVCRCFNPVQNKVEWIHVWYSWLSRIISFSMEVVAGYVFKDKCRYTARQTVKMFIDEIIFLSWLTSWYSYYFAHEHCRCWLTLAPVQWLCLLHELRVLLGRYLLNGPRWMELLVALEKSHLITLYVVMFLLMISAACIFN